MANLVDDFKNWIPGGVRIIAIDSTSNSNLQFELYDGVFTAKYNTGVSGTSIINFNITGTQKFIIFKILDTTENGIINAGFSPIYANHLASNYMVLNSGSSLSLYAYVYYQSSMTIKTFEWCRYLIVRIA